MSIKCVLFCCLLLWTHLVYSQEKISLQLTDDASAGRSGGGTHGRWRVPSRMARIDAVGDVRHDGVAGSDRSAPAAGLHDMRQAVRDHGVPGDLLLGYLPSDDSKAAMPGAVARRRLGATLIGEVGLGLSWKTCL